MSEPDHRLIAEFNARRSEEAFAALVRQHVNLVFATALRQVGDAGAAEEITQNVFVTLAQAAGKLGSHPTIAGWLHQTALNKSREWLRSELRRRRREQVAVNLELARTEGDSVWASLVPLLDEALLELHEPDRLAVILHFMEGQTFHEVGSALGIGEDTARKRVNRCLEQLAHFFRRRGFAAPALVAGAPLFTLSSHVAPAGLAASATTAGLAAAHSAATSTLTLIKGALKIMAWTKAKTAVVAIAAVILTAGTTTVVVKKVAAHLNGYSSWADDPKYWKTDSAVLEKLPAVFILRPTRFPDGEGGISLGNKMMGKDGAIQDLLAYAYGFSDVRIVFPDNLPHERYDLMLTLPNHSKETLQDELRKRFGLVAHSETRDADVLLLRVNRAAAPGLRISTGGNGSWIGNPHEITIKHQRFDGFESSLERHFGKPVINQTGLNNYYDIHIQWQARPGESDADAFQRALLDQLGLELVPTNMPIEMLVVERVKS